MWLNENENKFKKLLWCLCVCIFITLNLINHKFILLWVNVFINFSLIYFLNTSTFIYAIILFLIPQLFINMKLVS